MKTPVKRKMKQDAIDREIEKAHLYLRLSFSQILLDIMSKQRITSCELAKRIKKSEDETIRLLTGNVLTLNVNYVGEICWNLGIRVAFEGFPIHQ